MGFLSFTPAFTKCSVRILKRPQIKQKPHFYPQCPFQLLFLTTFRTSRQPPNSLWVISIPGAPKSTNNWHCDIHSPPASSPHLPSAPAELPGTAGERAEQEPEPLWYQGKMPIHGSTLTFHFKAWALPCHSWHMIMWFLGRNPSHWTIIGYLRNPVLQSFS